MTSRNVTQDHAPAAGEPPSLDAVELWLTATVERDYIARSVFTGVRAMAAAASRANATLHYLTKHQAQELLDDAQSRIRVVSKGLKVAFGAHAENLLRGLAQAAERRALSEASSPACTYRSEMSEHWRGSKEQLRAIGIALEGPYPGEPGGNPRCVYDRDARGWRVRISRASRTWADVFDVHIEVPNEVRAEAVRAQLKAKAEQRRLDHLRTMPTTPEAYRERVAGLFLRVAVAVQTEMEPDDGFRYTPEAVEAFVEMARDAYWFLKEGQTSGTSPRDALTRALVSNAKADHSLQRFLSNVRPDATH